MKYIQVTDPNAEELKEQINRVKGDRTMSTFADAIKISSPDVKVSAPTLSRACNWQKGMNPVSLDLLEAIAKIAKPETGVTIETLTTANGMRSQQEDDGLAQKDRYAKRRAATEKTERDVQMIIQNEIAIRGFSFQKLTDVPNWRSIHGFQEQSDRIFPRNFTFGYSVSGMSPCNVWKFALAQVKLYRGIYHLREGYVSSFIEKVSSVFAGDHFESERYENEKYSFVFIDVDMYHSFLNRMNTHGLRVNGLMTVILVDLGNNRVCEEQQLLRYDGEVAASFFRIPVVEETEVEFMDPMDEIED